ncbi:MAG: penicillin-binding protein 2 [Thermoleophilaceae bacterium]|jgi:penicillin-binding protein 2|nr:penicillin-binding protein 2 [Thermoleophilaceae bacterium]
MMYRNPDERRGPITPQLAIRVAIIGGVCLVMFGVVFFRLWYLQVLSGDKYLAEANNNQVRDITVQAPRGQIVDRSGRVLVDNRSGFSVEINPAKLPTDLHARAALYRNLSKVLRMSPREIRKTVNTQLKAVPFAKAVVKPDVSQPAFAYILEHQESFPGVDVEQVFLRSYPHHDVAAQIVGYVSQVNETQLKDKRFHGVKQGDRVGQAGIEYSYDRYLRGQNGANRVQVDATGAVRRELASRAPKSGRKLRLTLDYGVQQTGQSAMAGRHGGFVAMDIKNGEIRALGSSPSFDPNVFSKQIKQSDYSRLTSDANGAPLFNRAIQGGYPTGSTFKPITSVAALETGVITPDTPYTDGGSFSLPGGLVLHNAGGASYGTLSLRRALQVSSDVFFYHLGAELNGAGDGQQLQHWAYKLGIGRTSGIDLPGEQPGLLPTRDWRNRLFKKKQTDRPWSIGDNVNLGIGQGDVQANPLQMAVAYATIANGGYVVKPHLGLRVEDTVGRAVQEFRTPTRRRLKINPLYRRAILDGLQAAAESPGGTSYPVFKDFPIKIAGKTGTAQRVGQGDQSWYVALAPYPHPRYVVAATIENGGFGAEAAAPAVKQIIGKLFNTRVKNGGPVNLSGVNKNG